MHSFFDLRPKFLKIEQALIILIGSHSHSELFAIRYIFRGNFLKLGCFVLRSDLTHIWDHKNDEIDHKRKKRRPKSDFHIVVNSSDPFQNSSRFHRVAPGWCLCNQ